ncbi:metallophosphoesterase [Flavimarina sp. Hel_I_48]|uniref:metallophosphoesterase n=1 Tax=Flavimarina sp. Hel_I_48 TaxID=1392488 RepID=UPI0004DF29FA|nr:metallophosphoesterase [Flavimarina sp. Hel_I_48]
MRWFIFILLYIAIDIYSFQAFRTITKVQWLHYVYLALSLIVLANLIYHIANTDPYKGFDRLTMYALGFFLVLFVPKLLTVVFMLMEDLIRLLVGLYDRYIAHENRFVLPSRRKFISGLALGLAAVPFLSLLYGMYKGKYRFRVLNYELFFEDLPDAFDGYKITQISDVHSGSFDNREKIAYAVDLINQQNGDVILFTGDLVNNTATEMNDWKSLFSTLQAKDGVFSILGNHDYGDYVTWKSGQAKRQNLEDLKNLQRDMGWDLLLNEHRLLERDGQKIALVGVENWGAGGFKKAGDVDVASAGLKSTDFKILMSHDPSYWAEKIKMHPKNFQLTLSGHTHGMQFGIEIPGLIKWSPVQYRYKYWAGIYEQNKRMINVNRGFGFLGYPGRVGIWPEITTIILKRGNMSTI